MCHLKQDVLMPQIEMHDFILLQDCHLKIIKCKKNNSVKVSGNNKCTPKTQCFPIQFCIGTSIWSYKLSFVPDYNHDINKSPKICYKVHVPPNVKVREYCISMQGFSFSSVKKSAKFWKML